MATRLNFVGNVQSVDCGAEISVRFSSFAPPVCVFFTDKNIGKSFERVLSLRFTPFNNHNNNKAYGTKMAVSINTEI